MLLFYILRQAINNFRLLFLFALFLFNGCFISAQEPEKKFYTASVAFYNLENLFDTINDPVKNDEEFLPEGERKWTGDKYRDKLEKLSTVIEKLGDSDGPEILGVCEIENKNVLSDLILTEKLSSKGYAIAHVESPDMRGVDVALLYKSKYFIPYKITGIEVNDSLEPDFKTRNILIVSGILSNDSITFIVNHWPSRRGSGKDDKRIMAAKTARKAVDSLLLKNKNAKIILMGDFNDNPSDQSISKYLKALPIKKQAEGTLFNAMHTIHKKGYGTLSYQGIWNLFDQMIMTEAVLKNQNAKYGYLKESASIFYHKWLINQDGQSSGAPFRSFSGTNYVGGYSDHLPVYIYLVQEAKPGKN